MNDTKESYDQKLSELNGQVQGFLDYSWKQHKQNIRLNNIVVLLGVSLGFGVIITGALDKGMLTVIVGAAISALFGIQNAFRFSEKARFWEIKHGQAKDIRDRLKYKIKSETDFQGVVDMWLGLRKELLENLPSTRGLEEGMFKKNDKDL